MSPSLFIFSHALPNWNCDCRLVFFYCNHFLLPFFSEDFLLPIIMHIWRAKVMVHKSFPYAPCINTSQPSNFFLFVFVISLSTLLKNRFSLTLSLSNWYGMKLHLLHTSDAVAGRPRAAAPRAEVVGNGSDFKKIFTFKNPFPSIIQIRTRFSEINNQTV